MKIVMNTIKIIVNDKVDKDKLLKTNACKTGCVL